MRALVAALLFACLPAVVVAQVADDQLPDSFALSIKPHSGNSIAAGGVLGSHSNGSVLGVDSLANWSSYFYVPGFDSNGFPQFTWQYTMMGNAPFGQNNEVGDEQDGHSTLIGAPIVPVNIDLRNFDGTPRFDPVSGKRMYLDASQYVNKVLKSPVFVKTAYSSSDDPTQYADAIQRAEFFRQADRDWHTLLRPRVATPRTMVLIRGTYRFNLYPNGSLRYVLVNADTFANELFPPTETDTTTIMGSVEHTGEVATKDFSTFLFPDTYLYIPDKNGNPAVCCIIGYHSYDLEPGSAANGFREKRYVMNYSSYVNSGAFGPTFTDITPLSHEVSEAFNDPFVNNATPWWLAPNGNCQNNLEVGDVIEGLPNATFPITVNGFTYHPQNEALLQWFADQTPSTAIHHAYSYPDEAVLTSGASLQLPGCPATPPKTAKN